MNYKILILAILALPPSLLAQVLNDDLIENLSCQNLSLQSIYQSIKADAFSANKHTQKENWSTGVIANCWSLSRMQRLHFYLSRTTLLDETTATRKSEDILNMIRGSTPDQINQPMIGTKEIENKLKKLTVYELTESKAMEKLEAKSKMSTGSIKDRNFVDDIETYQVRRFNNPANLSKYVLSAAPSPAENEKLFRQIAQNLDQKKLTLINMRAFKTTQHVVVAKSYKKDELGNYQIDVYDSNYPLAIQKLIYVAAQKMFISPHTMGSYFRKRNMAPDSPLAIFIVDEEDREMIEKALLSYYQKVCAG